MTQITQQESGLGSSKRLQDTPLFNISLEQVKICFEEGMDLNNLYLLEAFSEGTDLTVHYSSAKFAGYKQTLLRKGYINEQGIVLVKGKELLDMVKHTKPRQIEKNIKQTITPFDEWWTTYPGTDTFDYNGRVFMGTRSLRAKKEECRLSYNKLLNGGLYSHQELLNALKLEIEYKKADSYKTGQNKMAFMKNSLSYLNQQAFEGFVELVRKNILPKTENNNKNNTEFGGFSI